MAKNKNYSADALIQQDVNQQLEQQRQQPKQPETQVDVPVVTLTNDGATPTPTIPIGGGLRGSQYVTSVSLDNAPKPKPFMALDVSNSGIPIYGTGFKGWVRKWWADITDPQKLLQDANDLSSEKADEIWASYNERVTETGQILEDKLKWSQWGLKFFGLEAEEIAALTAGGVAEREIADELGNSQVGTAISRATRIAIDTTQNAIWTGLNILSLDDTLMRKIHTTVQGLDSIADRFNKDEDTTFVQKLYSSNPFDVAKDVYTVTKNIVNGNLTWEDTKETISKFQAGSEMAYTMVFDQMMRAEFEKGIAEGKDPIVLAQNLGNIKTELIGSIAGSPSTYLGLAILKPVNIFTKAGRASMPILEFAGRPVKLFGANLYVPFQTIAKIPTFGEIIGANVSKIKVANEALRFTESSIPELTNVIKKIETASGEQEALKILNETATTYANKLNEMSTQKKWWNLTAFDSNGKISVTARDSSIFIQSLVATRGIDTSLQIMRDMVIAKRGGSEAVQAAARLLSNNNAGSLTSDVGNMTAEIVNRLDNAKIFDKITEFGNNPVKLHDELFKTLEDALSDFIPSVDEMFDAKRLLSDSVEFGSITDINKINKTQELAKRWDELPTVVKVVNRATRIPEAIAKKTTAAMAYTFMNLVPRAWARNITGQAWAIAGQLGVKTAIEASLQALFGLSKGKTKSILDEGNDLLIKRLGYIPASSASSIRKITHSATKGAFSFGMMPAIGRSEELTAQTVKLVAASEHIQKSLPAVVKNLPEWDNLVNALPTEQQPLMFSALKRAYGNFDEAVDLFRKWVGNGEIETWRITEPSEQMRKHLDSMGLMDNFYEAQMAARTPQEFTQFVDDFIKTYTDEVTKAAESMPNTLSSMPDELSDFGMDLARQLPEEQQNVMRSLIQGWQNTLEQLDKTIETVFQSAAKQANEISMQGNPVPFQVLEQIRSQVSNLQGAVKKVYPEINEVRSQVVNLVRQLEKTKTRQEAIKLFQEFDVFYKGKSVFNLTKIFPNLDYSNFDARTAKNLVWTSFFENSANRYRNTNVGVYEQVLSKMDELAQAFDSTLDDIASSGQGGDSPLRVLAMMREETMRIEQAHSWQRFFRQLNFQPSDNPDALLKDVVGKFESVFPDWKGGQSHIVNIVNKGRANKIPYDQITLTDALSAIKKSKVIPPYDKTLPTTERVLWEGLKEFTSDVKRWKDAVINDWGVKTQSLPSKVEDLLRKTRTAIKPRMDLVKQEAGVIADSTRNFVLHDYNKTYLDHALTYVLGNSMHYWTTRTYSKALETLIDNPKYANVYLRYKQYMTKKHADMPEWYRQNLQVSLPGISNSNPYFINLEASINPVYGLTGTDFNDPRKRVDWLSRAVDDMNKLGPTFSPLISWAIAMHLYNKGEEDAGARWTNRLLPQTQLIKSATASADNVLQKMGLDVDFKPLELDPFVNFLDGGVDPYERNRVAAALAMMVRDGTITPEQMIEASRNKEGDIWQQAIELSAEKRFQGDFTSFFFGAGIRPRTQEDMVIEKFWSDYGALTASSSMMTPEEYREAWDNLRENPEYGMFADALLLSRKAGAEQDTAYAYNVLGRIPPGGMIQVAEAVGINPEMLEAFYENKGDFSEMGLTPQDQARFMSGVADIGAILAMPNNPTRQEWTQARNEYQKMKDVMESTFGDGIYEAIDGFYDADNRSDYLELNPEIQQALDFQTQYVNQNQLLSRYYGGIDSVQQYYRTSTESILLKEFGAEQVDLYEEYSDPRISPERKKELSRILKLFLSRRSDLREQNLQAMARIALLLPDAPQPTAQENVTPQGVSQNDLFQLTQPAMTPQQWEEIVGASTMQIIQDFVYGGEEIPYVVSNNLDYIAERQGFSNGDDMLMQIIQSMPQVQP